MNIQKQLETVAKEAIRLSALAKTEKDQEAREAYESVAWALFDTLSLYGFKKCGVEGCCEFGPECGFYHDNWSDDWFCKRCVPEDLLVQFDEQRWADIEIDERKTGF